MIRLKKTKAFVYNKHANFLVSYDHMSGKKDRYTVLILTSGEPIVIGRELDLPYIRKLIEEYNEEFIGWTGERREAVRICQRVQQRRSAKA